MLWSRYFVGVRHFATCREKRPVTVREMLINIPVCDTRLVEGYTLLEDEDKNPLFRNGEGSGKLIRNP